ncbi:restriction endonuclease subunit S [Bacteroides gallinaceum]|uniref:restriction endonuclease subunit S n=1 Tax=Bacteroides gallinaceum TaxID=1462571 RepID=UPI0025AAFE49|nr:restriction endonuclease subunit S [Bacteroides gallinaceum]MDN0078308.1 restriction endonuclease subunit S [Bacteroides gallinaceum]
MAKFTFGQIAKEVRLTYNGDKTDMPIVGLEHIVPKELTVTNYDINTNNTFTKSFKKGQILFGRRRAYQHKAAIATFNGICSGDITVIEPIEGMVYPALLPFIVQNDAFFSHAVQGSAGSLSPRVKWEHLSSYEIELPSIEEQRVLAEKLWAAYRLKESYKRLLAATDEMIKSQFIEMFGNPVTNSKSWQTKAIMEVAPEQPSKKRMQGKVWLLNLDMIESNTGKVIEKVYETSENTLSVQPFDEGNVLFSKLRPYLNKVVVPDEYGLATTELVPLRPNQEKLHKVFLSYLLRSQQFVTFANKISGGTKMPRMPLAELRKFECILPPMSEQLKFVGITEQADKSKFELRKSIDAIDQVIKSLING